MENFNAKITVKNKEENTSYNVNVKYDKEKEYIYYVEKDELKTATIFDYQENTLKRDNEKMYLELKFENNKTTISTMFLKDLEKKLELEVFTNKIFKNEENVEIEYSLFNEKYTYKIEKEN